MENKTSIYIWQYGWERNQTWTFQNFDEFLAILTAKTVITRGKIGTWLIDHHKSFVSKRPIVWGQKNWVIPSYVKIFSILPSASSSFTGLAPQFWGLGPVTFMTFIRDLHGLSSSPEDQQQYRNMGIPGIPETQEKPPFGSNAVSNCPTLPIFIVTNPVVTLTIDWLYSLC